MTSTNTKKDGVQSYSPKKMICIAAVVVVLVVVLQAGGGILTYYLLDTWDERGTFGDMFGAVNTLFSGLALAGVICAILLQSIELRHQREELELTRKELTKSAEAQAETARILKETEEQQLLRWRYEQRVRTQVAAPILAYLSDQGSGVDFEIRFQNRGGRAVDVVLEGKKKGVEINPADVLPEWERTRETGVIRLPFGDENNKSFRLAYTDVHGFRERLLVRWSPSERRLRSDVLSPQST